MALLRGAVGLSAVYDIIPIYIVKQHLGVTFSVAGFMATDL